MMRTIILPGYSLRNKEWAGEIAKEISAEVHFWRHWSGGSMSKKYEVEKLVSDIKEDRVNILAKSVGTMVSMHLLQAASNQINKIILCGIPSVSDERLKLFKNSLKEFPGKKIIVFQNEKDPLGNFDEVKKFMSKVNPKIVVIKMPRGDHHYPYVNDFKKFLEN